MAIQEKTLICKDCSKSFIFTVEEQEFFQKKGFTNEPGRCSSCRQSRRENGGTRSYGSFGGGSRQMYSATCAQCGKEAQVPFEPRTGRPVYCSNCYSTRGASSHRY